MKKLFLLITLTLTCFTIGFAQQWTELNNFPGDARSAFSSFSIENKGYVVGGYISSSGNYAAYNGMWEFNPTDLSWKKISNYPGGGVYGAFSFVIGSTVYIGLGADETGTGFSSCWSYNKIDGWNPIADFPSTKRVYTFSFTAGGKGYVGGGYSPTGSLLNDMWEYDPATDKWTKKANYPGGGRIGLAAFSINEKGYVGMGDDNNNYFDDFYEYNPINNMWTAKASFPGSNRAFSANVTVDNSGYLLGGESNIGSMTNEMWKYDVINNTWTSSYDFTGTERRHGGLFFINGSFYYTAGQYSFSDDEMLTDFWALNAGLVGEKTITQADVTIYPVPFNNTITISAPNATINTVTIYNSAMQAIYTGIETSINTQNWTAGIYYVKITTAQGTSTQKVIKQ